MHNHSLLPAIVQNTKHPDKRLASQQPAGGCAKCAKWISGLQTCAQAPVYTLAASLIFILVAGEFQFAGAQNKPQQPSPITTPLELTRPTRPWEFTSALGTRSGLLGEENGNFEAWVYPLKILRNFHLRFKIDGEIIEARNLARSTTVRPESTTITYAWDTFSVKETLCAPVHEPGAVIQLEIDTSEPLEVEAVFERDFQLEWPGAMGGSDIEWNQTLHAFAMDENQHKFTALIGSPSATTFHTEFSSNYANAKENSFSLGVTRPGKETKVVVIAASFQNLPKADVTYRKLAATYPQLITESAAYYQHYLDNHLSLDLPDESLQQAYQWAQVSVLQGLVENPYLGTGLVAGYKDSSDDDQRPGYAWFFGRDALWTSLALNAEGDYATTRTALDFLSKYQRKDGKITHEIAQGASFVPWFDSMPYAYASADATPLFIIAMEDYVRHSGDTAFAKEKWDNLQRASQFVISTYDNHKVAKNDGIGHGWVEGGPLLPVKNELYQASVAVEAIRALADLGQQLGKDQASSDGLREFDSAKAYLNLAFWIPAANRYAFALDAKDKQIDTTSVLATVPMWFGLLDDSKAISMIHSLAGPEIQTPWGMRIIPATDPKYDAAGYHSGTVWPLFTGWASVGEYKYHQALPAYANLRSNALLTFDGSLGHVAEVLSGTYYQTLSSGSPHQIWSSAMVISSLLKGLLGLDADALHNHLSFSPHVPVDWTHLKMNHVTAGSCMVNITYLRSIDNIRLEVEPVSGKSCMIEFSPALSPRSHVTDARVNGHRIPFRIQANTSDQHVSVNLQLDQPEETSKGNSGKPVSLVIQLTNDFGLSQPFNLPSLGSANEGLRILSEQWSADGNALTLNTASAKKGTYDLKVWNPTEISTVEGAALVSSQNSTATSPNSSLSNSSLQIPLDGDTHYLQRQVVIHFNSRKK